MSDALGLTYYPSCVVNIRLLFDDAFLRGAVDPESLTVDETGGLVQPAPANTTGVLPIFGNQAKSGSHILGRIPKSCSVEIPAYRQAGKFRMTFDFRDLPIDPRLVRAAAVEVYMDTVTPDDFAKAIPQVSPPGGARTSVMSMLKPSPSNLAMQGLVDSWHVSHTSSGSEVTIEGRDLVGMCLQAVVTAEMIAKIDLPNRIDVAIQTLVSNMQGWAGELNVLTLDEDWPKRKIPSIGKAITTQVSTPRVRKVATKKSAVRLSVGADPDKLNFWDVVTRWCYYVGAVPYFTIVPTAGTSPNPQFKTTLMIRPANSLYSQIGAMEGYQPATPFTGGLPRTTGGQTFRVRRMMFGRNVEELTFERKFAGLTLPKLVKVVSYDTSSKESGEARLIEAIYPTELAEKALSQNASDSEKQDAARIANATNPAKARKTRAAPSGEIAATDQLRISVPGVTDKETLEFIAKQIFNEIGRGEQGGSCTTKSLSSFGGRNEDPDLVRLRPGDGINIMVDQRPLSERAPNVSPVAAMQQISPAELAKKLTARLGDAALANAIAISLKESVPAIANIYRVSNVKLDWNIKSGISVAFDFHNFIALRNDVTPETPVAPNTVAAKGVTVPSAQP